LRFVENGAELMDYLHHRNRFREPGSSPRPNLILLDLNMPKKDGREALREIKADAELKRIPVVVFTTSGADSDIARVYELGGNSFISKPTAFNALVKVMKTIGQYWFEVVVLPAKG
jgi:CheY-like chemotaxis protein